MKNIKNISLIVLLLSLGNTHKLFCSSTDTDTQPNFSKRAREATNSVDFTPVSAIADNNTRRYPITFAQTNEEKALLIAINNNDDETIQDLVVNKRVNPNVCSNHFTGLFLATLNPNNVVSFLLMLKTMLANKKEFTLGDKDGIRRGLKFSLVTEPRNDQEFQKATRTKKMAQQILDVFNALTNNVNDKSTITPYTTVIIQAYKEFKNGNHDDLYHILILTPRLIRQKNKALHNAIKLQFLENSPFKKESFKPLLFFLCKTKGDREYVKTLLLSAPNKDTNSANSSSLEGVD